MYQYKIICDDIDDFWPDDGALSTYVKALQNLLAEHPDAILKPGDSDWGETPATMIMRPYTEAELILMAAKEAQLKKQYETRNKANRRATYYKLKEEFKNE